MSEIKHRQNKTSPEIDYAEIYFPDAAVLGEGIFYTSLVGNALINRKTISSVMINVPVFQISLNIDSRLGKILIMLGLADGTQPSEKKEFSFPNYLDISETHLITVSFYDWKVTKVLVDDKELHLV